MLALLLVAAFRSTSRAEAIGIGLFLGEPSGLDIKVGLSAKSSITS